MSDPVAPLGTANIRSYHAHIYFRDHEERERALLLRGWLAERFPVQLGRVHEVPVGPHTAPMYQVAFEREVFASLVPWLMLNHLRLHVLIHPNTGRSRDDHLLHATWLQGELAVRGEVLSNELRDAVISPIQTNTTPHLPSE